MMTDQACGGGEGSLIKHKEVKGSLETCVRGLHPGSAVLKYLNNLLLGAAWETLPLAPPGKSRCPPPSTRPGISRSCQRCCL
eukprot:362004-Chlamydomonas_euryale.AAC.9